MSSEKAAAISSSDELPAIVGSNLRRLRTRRGLSLERLASISGVSRAMLGQIETGKSVPTISLLWKVATSLDVPFSALIAAEDTNSTVVLKREKAKILESSQGRFTSRALFPFDEKRKAEFYELRIAPKHVEESEAHAVGTIENLTVAKGRVEIELNGARTELLAEGDSIFFKADVPHSYRNIDPKETAVVYLVMTYVEEFGGSK